MTITLVTGNQNKLRELEAIAPKSLQFDSKSLDLSEIQSLDLREIVAGKLRQAYEAVKQPVIVEDVAAELDSLQGLPGPFIKFFEQKLGRDALYKLSTRSEHRERQDDRVTIRCVAGYYEGGTMLFGEGLLTGTVVAPRGENGFGFDSVIVPDNDNPENRTLAEMTADEKNAISHRRKAFMSLIGQLEA